MMADPRSYEAFLQERREAICERIADSARRAGREPGEVEAIAVSKTVDADAAQSSPNNYSGSFTALFQIVQNTNQLALTLTGAGPAQAELLKALAGLWGLGVKEGGE